MVLLHYGALVNLLSSHCYGMAMIVNPLPVCTLTASNCTALLADGGDVVTLSQRCRITKSFVILLHDKLSAELLQPPEYHNRAMESLRADEWPVRILNFFEK